MNWQPLGLAVVALTLLAALFLTLRDVVRTPAGSTYTRGGSLLVALGLGLFFISWLRGDSFLFADLLLVVGVMGLIVGRRRREPQPDRGWRRRRAKS